MKATRFIPISALLMIVVACGLLAVGCASDNIHGDTVSERPWNDTQGWQGGLPSGLNEGR